MYLKGFGSPLDLGRQGLGAEILEIPGDCPVEVFSFCHLFDQFVFDIRRRPRNQKTLEKNWIHRFWGLPVTKYYLLVGWLVLRMVDYLLVEWLVLRMV